MPLALLTGRRHRRYAYYHYINHICFGSLAGHRIAMTRCRKDIIASPTISAVDSFYDLSIRENHRKEQLSRGQANSMLRDCGSNRTSIGANLVAPNDEPVQRQQKNLRAARRARRSKSSNCKESDSRSNRSQSAVAAFCSVNFGLYSRRLFCHSNDTSGIGSHDVSGGGKS